jgi:hypothetical protein
VHGTDITPAFFAYIHSLLAAIAVPTYLISGEVIEINWTFTANDPPTFNLFLRNSTSALDLNYIIG